MAEEFVASRPKSYWQLPPQGRALLEARVLRRDPSGGVQESPGEALERIVSAVAAVEDNWAGSQGEMTRRFRDSLGRLEFLPNSPTLMNAGRELGQLAACFVLPIEDSIDSIFDAVRHAAVIQHTGGGTGFSFSHLRSRGTVVDSVGVPAAGPVEFMRIFNEATRVISHRGQRRGANMAVLRADHPDILNFVDVKSDASQLVHFNLSVAVTDAILEKFQHGGSIDLLDHNQPIPLNTLDAKRLFDQIVERAWATGEPGLLFVDTIEGSNPTPHLGRMESTNPCGEVPLLPFESCNLGSIDVARFVTPDGSTSWSRLAETVRLGIRFLDNVIEANRFPNDQTSMATLRTRKVGLGVMGFADYLIALGIPYASDEGVAAAERLMSFVQQEAVKASEELAERRGAFPEFERSRLASGRARRNATVTTIAPTGTISLLAGCSAGIEPIFAPVYSQQAVATGETYRHIQPGLLRLAGHSDHRFVDAIERESSVQGFGSIPAAVRRLFLAAHEIDPSWHVKMQAAFQAHVDNSVSKTVNLPSSATREDVRAVFLQAYLAGCKGITVYRSGSRAGQGIALGVLAP